MEGQSKNIVSSNNNTEANQGVLRTKQEKVKELIEIIDFWINYAQGQIKYFNEVYPIDEMERNVDRLGIEAGSPNKLGTLAERTRWIKNSLDLYSRMIPRFTEIKKYLEQGKLEFPWGGNIETEVEGWKSRRASL